MPSRLYPRKVTSLASGLLPESAAKWRRLTTRALVIIVVALFVGELGLMKLESLALACGATPVQFAFADALLLALVLGPLLWWVIAQPLTSLLSKEAQRFEWLLESAPDAVLGLDGAGTVLWMNGQVTLLFGYSRSDLVGMPIGKLIPELAQEGDLSDHAVSRERSGAHPARVGKMLTAVGRDGTAVPVDASFGRLHMRDGSFAIAILRDVSERVRIEKELADANSRLTLGIRDLERYATAMSLLREMGGLLQSSRSRDDVFLVAQDFGPRLFDGRCGTIAVTNRSNGLIEPAASWGTNNPIEKAFPSDDCWAIRLGRGHTSKPASCEAVCSNREGNGGRLCEPLAAFGETLGVLSISDIDAAQTELRRVADIASEHFALALANVHLRERLREESVRDSLTGAFNRRYLDEFLDAELARATRSCLPLSLILLDVDHFKRFNDTHGHGAGDALQRSLASFIKARVRASDAVCRYGGDEFVVILPDCDTRGALECAEKLRLGVRSIEGSGGAGGISISLGVAAFPADGVDRGGLLRAADIALYEAKNLGRDRVVAASRGDESEGYDRTQMD